MNSVVLIGRLARDPEISYSKGDTPMAIAKFTLAVNRQRKKGADQGADFIRVTAFGKTADNVGKYLFKGRQAAVKGRIQTGSYKDKDGKTIFTTDVIADEVEFLGGGTEANVTPADSAQENAKAKSRGEALDSAVREIEAFDDLPESFMEVDDDIPF